MVKIITGPINTGKTSWLVNDFKSKKHADGFACKKVKVNDEHIGYELVHLATGETCQFIRKINHIPEGWNEAFRLGMHYTFNKEGFNFAEKICDKALKNKVSCFYLDEVAHLELKDQGFAEILKRILDAKIDLVLVVREALVEKICEKFGIKEYEIIKPNFNSI
jgi:nucleoside-triphosphatase THEP1